MPNSGIRRAHAPPGPARPGGRRWPGRPGRARGTPRPAPVASRSSSVDVGRQHVGGDPARGQPARHVALDAEVERGDREPVLALGRDHVRLRRWSPRRTGRRRPSPALPAPAPAAPAGRSSTLETPTRIAPRSRRCRVSARVSTPLMPTTPSAASRSSRLAGGAPVGADPGRVADHVAGDPDPAGLVVLAVDAGVADVRRGLHHDLPVVRRVGQRLLVAGHAGVEDRLAEGLPDAPYASPRNVRPSSRTRIAVRCASLARPFRRGPSARRAGRSPRRGRAASCRRTGCCGCGWPAPPGRPSSGRPGRPG